MPRRLAAQTPTIGIPRSLLYHKYRVLWTRFFEDLGCRTVVSPETNRRILARGTSLSVDETCLSVKVYLGHVAELQEKADVILIPRLVSLKKNEETCVKFWATCDLVLSALPGTRVIEYEVDVREGTREMTEMVRLGESLCGHRSRATWAYVRAKAAQARDDRRKAREQRALMRTRSDLPRVLVVAHPYNLHDDLIGQPVTSYLESLGVQVMLSDAVMPSQAHALSKRLSKGLYWTYNKELLGAVEQYRRDVDGIVFLVTFPCGPDSLVTELCQRTIKDVPLLVLVIDELQGEAALRTRLESFVDILALRRAAS